MSIPRALTDPATSEPSALGARRAAVLDRLVEAGRPVAADEMAELTGLHVNTARFHLDRLVEQGRAERQTEERATPGRPRIQYVARAAASDSPSSYRLLARMLVGLVTTLDPEGAAAVDAGRAWGRHLVPPVPPTARVDALEALRRLDALMDEVGFAPETTIGPEPEVRLHHCPFLEVAQESPEVVCALHRGLMEGALDALGAPVRLGDLQPFDTPQSCLARLQ
jgi:predicted ArsR family transcriptional regulator